LLIERSSQGFNAFRPFPLPGLLSLASVARLVNFGRRGCRFFATKKCRCFRRSFRLPARRLQAALSAQAVKGGPQSASARYVRFRFDPRAPPLTACLLLSQDLSDLAVRDKASGKSDWLVSGLSPPRLTFLASFCEGVVESKDESWRVRRLMVRFYTVDASVEMFDVPEKNDGLPHGKFMSRAAVPGVTVNSFRIGGTVEFLGRIMTIHACDDFTRVRTGHSSATERCRTTTSVHSTQTYAAGLLRAQRHSSATERTISIRRILLGCCEWVLKNRMADVPAASYFSYCTVQYTRFVLRRNSLRMSQRRHGLERRHHRSLGSFVRPVALPVLLLNS
jgi:hypothetical protein